MQQKPKKTAETIRGELIGTCVKIAENKNRCSEKIKGVIIDETKNTITIKTQKGNKKIIKEQIKSMMQEKDGKQKIITGKQIQSRPEERIKK